MQPHVGVATCVVCSVYERLYAPPPADWSLRPCRKVRTLSSPDQSTRLTEAPLNLHEFVDEIAPEIQRTFGIPAAHQYRVQAIHALRATFGSPAVETWGTVRDNRALSLLFATSHQGRRTISFLHGLAEASATDAAERLLRGYLAQHGAAYGPIITDYLPLDRSNLGSCFLEHGFTLTPRQLLLHPSPGEYPETALDAGVRPAGMANENALAQVLVDAYRHDPGHFLFPEVQSPESAQNFLRATWGGAHGAHLPGYTLAAWREGTCAGLAIGTQPYPAAGFVLHLAVAPDFQGQGIGTSLLRALCREFFATGASRVLLGVTESSRARALYQREGFRMERPLPVYHRDFIPTALSGH